jgi:L-amino acid N-acyltransferase YncA
MMLANKNLVPFVLEAMLAADYPAVAEIFEQGIAGGNATYDTAAATWSDWDAKHVAACRWVAKSLESGEVLGWAALSPISTRCVFVGVAELSIYIRDTVQRQGLGDALMTRIIEDSEENGFWTLQSGIFPENLASIQLHEKHGFRVVGYREKIGQMKNGLWRDIVFMERRSERVGQ